MALTILGIQMSNLVRSLQIICQYKGLAYELQTELDGKPLMENPEAHSKYHPFRKFPVLIDGDFSLPESMSIARYLEQMFDDKPLLPSDPKERAIHDAWLNHIAITIDKAIVRDILVELAFPKGENGQVRFDYVKAALPALHQALDVLDQQLAGNEYLMGNRFSLCDAFALPMLDYLDVISFPDNPLQHYPKLINYIERLRQLPCCEGVLTPPNLS